MTQVYILCQFNVSIDSYYDGLGLDFKTKDKSYPKYGYCDDNGYSYGYGHGFIIYFQN